MKLDHLNSSSPQSVLTLRQGLEIYYQRNPEFTRNCDLWVGWVRIPWKELERHDIMHVVTGYATTLDHELRLIGFLLTALTWRRPWYYYAQNLAVFGELLGRSLLGKTLGDRYYTPLQVCRMYLQGMRQGLTVCQKIDAYINADTVMNRELRSLRAEYGIQNAGTWD